MSKPAASSSGSAWALIGTAVGAAANFAVLVLVSAVYGQTMFGVFAAATALFQLSAVLFRLGAEIGSTYLIARLRSNGSSDGARAAIVAAVVPVAVVSVLIAIGGIVAADPIARALSEDGTTDTYASMLRILALALPVATIGEVLLGATRGFGSMRPTVLASNFGRQAGQLVTVGAAAMVTRRTDILAFAWALPYAATVIHPALWLRRATAGRTRSTGSIPWGPFWRYTSPQAANAAVQGGLEKTDIILLGRMTGADATAVYSLANRFVHVLVLSRYAINVSQSAAFAAGFERGDLTMIRKLADKVATWTLLVCGPALTLLVLFPDAVMTVLGAEYSAGSTSLAVLAGSVLVALLLGPVDGLLLMSGASMRSFVNSAIALALNIGLNLWLIPRYGPTGAAVAWTVALLAGRLLGLFPLQRRYAIQPLGHGLRSAVSVIAATVGVVGLALRLIVGDERTALAAAVVIGGGLFLAVVIRLHERLMVAELVAGLRPRGSGGNETEAFDGRDHVRIP